MKKLLLSTLLSVFVLGSVFGQIRFQSDAVIGQTLQSVNPLNKDTFTLHFNTSKSASSWAPARKEADLGKDSVSFQKTQTQRGIQVKAFLDNTTTTAYENGSLKCNNAGGNGNPGRVTSMASLTEILSKSVITGTINGSTSDSLTRPAACLFDIAAGDQAFGMYPGKTTKIEYVYRFDFTGKKCSDDISFEMWTYDAGNTGKTAIYELAVYTSSTFSDANLLGSRVNVYTTNNPKKTVNVANEIGVAYSAFTNKSLYIVVKTLGTNGDGITHARDVNNLPVYIDPTVVFDNFFMTYEPPYFTYPVAVSTASNYVNYNNGAPEIKATDAGLTNPGTPKPITTGTSTPVSILLKSIGRAGTFTVIENISHSSFITYNVANAFLKNDGQGNYNVPVTCTETINSTSNLWTLTIAAPTAGTFVDDDMTFNFNVNRPTDGTTNLRLEISNGSARFWYDFSFVASTTTDLNEKTISPIGISTDNSKISVINATENVSIFSISGQRINTLSANDAARGITVKTGAYIVKHGSEVRKVLVK